MTNEYNPPRPRRKPQGAVKNCDQKRKNLSEAETRFYAVTHNLEAKKRTLARLVDKRQSLALQIEREKQEKERARSAGAIAGASLVGMLSARLGLGKILSGANLGLGVGGNIGENTEEAIDFLTAQKTDGILEFEKLKIKREIEDIQLMIEQTLVPAVDRERKNLDAAKREYQDCLQP